MIFTKNMERKKEEEMAEQEIHCLFPRPRKTTRKQNQWLTYLNKRSYYIKHLEISLLQQRQTVSIKECIQLKQRLTSIPTWYYIA